MTKRRLLLKEKSLRLYPMHDHLEFGIGDRRSVIAYKHISELYLYSRIKIPLHDLVRIAEHVPVYIVDRYGYVKAHIVLEYADETR